MTFTELHLPNVLIAELYGPMLVSLEPQRTSEGTGELDTISFLGSNEKQLTIIVNNQHEKYLSEGDLQFLTRLLSACKLHLGDIALVNKAGKDFTFERLASELSPSRVILFGVEADEIGLPFRFPHLKLQKHGSATFLQAPAISELENGSEKSKQHKSDLWNCLKQLFQIK